MKVFFRRHAVLLILLIAAAIEVSPHLLIGVPFGHDLVSNLYSYHYFTEQLLSGEIYPRWLFGSRDGLGSLGYYLGAPLPAYVYSVFGVLFGHDIMSIAYTYQCLTIYFLSGGAFYWFISPYTDRFWAIASSLLYMLIPYHYIDMEVRSALGEVFVYVWLPLIMVGLSHPERTWNRLLLSIVSYAGLVLSHLPSALLVAPVIVLFSMVMGTHIHWYRSVWHAMLIGLVGICIGAFYIVPALLLRDTLTPDALVTSSGSHYDPVNWLIGNPNGLHSFGITVYKVLAATTLLGVGLVLLARIGHVLLAIGIGSKTKNFREIDWRLAAACLLTLVGSWLLMTNITRPIWEHVWFIKTVQFPWRLGTVIDFCSVVLVGIAGPPVFSRVLSMISVGQHFRVSIERSIIVIALLALAAADFVFLFPQRTFSANSVPDTILITDSALASSRPRWMVESYLYLPNKNIADLSNINLATSIHRAGISRWWDSIHDMPQLLSTRDLGDGESILIEEDTTKGSISAILLEPTTITLRKIYYPHWRLRNSLGQEIDVYPDPETGLVRFDLGAGKHALTLDRRLLASEWAGLWISMISLCAMVLVSAFFGKRRV